jgi:tetratricopeptide (TPR) repeat protein
MIHLLRLERHYSEIAMEFLDDLLNQSESSEEPEHSEAESAPKSDAADAAQPDQPPAAIGAADEEAWEDLLESVDFEDANGESDADGRTSNRGRSRTLSATQKITLGVLGVLAIGLWAVVILLITRSFSAGDLRPASDDAQVTVVSYADTTPDAEGDEAASVPTDMPAGETPTPAPTAEPTLTPTPPPPVFTTYDSRIRETPDDIELYLLRGRQYITLGAYEAALADFSRAQELDAESTEAYVGEGWASLYSGRWRQAEAAFGTAIALDEDLDDAHFGIGQVAFYQGQYEAAAKSFDWAAEIDPTNAEAEAWLAIASAKLTLPDEVFGAVTRAMSETQELPIVYIAQSWARRIEDPPDIDGAQGDLLYARELAPNNFLTLNALAQFYIDHRPERLTEAEQLATYAEDWATHDLHRAVALQTLGRVYLAQDRKADAERVFVQAIDLIAKEGDIRLDGLEEDLRRAQE